MKWNVMTQERTYLHRCVCTTEISSVKKNKSCGSASKKMKLCEAWPHPPKEIHIFKKQTITCSAILRHLQINHAPDPLLLFDFTVTSNNKKTKVEENSLPYICHCHWETGHNALFILCSRDTVVNVHWFKGRQI